MTTSTITEINMDNVLELLAAAVETRGHDYVYRDEFNQCSYATEDDCPMCLIGVLLHQLGADLTNAGGDAVALFGFYCDDTPEGQATDPKRYANLPIYDACETNCPEVACSEGAVLVLLAAQSVQDSDERYSWGQAYDTATEVHRLLTERAA